MGRSQLLKGTTSLLVLAVLREGELYGYEIAARIRERSGAFIDPGEGWLYPALHRLEAEGALEASWRESGIGPRRRYYRLTVTGRRMFDAEAGAWESFVRSVRLVAGGPADG
jgi:DNA-binding PadR family transcriptional regulator